MPIRKNTNTLICRAIMSKRIVFRTIPIILSDTNDFKKYIFQLNIHQKRHKIKEILFDESGRKRIMDTFCQAQEPEKKTVKQKISLKSRNAVCGYGFYRFVIICALEILHLVKIKNISHTYTLYIHFELLHNMYTCDASS